MIKTGRRNAKERLAIDRLRESWRRAIGKCEACGHHPRNRWPNMPEQMSVLTIHEIGRGMGLRKLCEDKPYATLCLCWKCNSLDFVKASLWPIPKQLCLLLARRPEDYDLRAFCRLIRPNAPNWIAAEEVLAFVPELEPLTRKACP